MKLQTATLLLTVLSAGNVREASGLAAPGSATRTTSFQSRNAGSRGVRLSVSAVEAEMETEINVGDGDAVLTVLDYGIVNKLSFRELQRECKERGLAAIGNTASLRSRLLSSAGIVINSPETESPDLTDTTETNDEMESSSDISFTDQSDPDFDFNSLVSEIGAKCESGHWKAAVRKLKQLSRRFPTKEIPAPLFSQVLETCSSFRLQGGRASAPARKIMEEMAEKGHTIPPVANKCVVDCLGAAHAGGGIDTALAMLASMESSDAEMTGMDTFGAVVAALSRDGSLEEAALLLRAMVVDHSFTPSLATFEDIARSASKRGNGSAIVLQVLTLVKAAGYELDTIGSATSGRSILACGLIAAEQMDNLALGLRILTAAAKAEGCAPDKGDDLVCTSSAAAQRAGNLIHKRTIDKAVKEGNWKLAVRVLEFMTKRSLKPSTATLRKVVTLCAKCEKSRKATALLLDWTQLYNENKAEKPPLNVFNTVINTCEICGEEELTLVVLDTMKKTHQTDGNIITLNIALKRLAKLGNKQGIEGIMIGALQSGIEPSVVSYTTAIAACARKDGKDATMAFEWMNRMRSRNVKPNFHTYNTALAACIDGTFESTVIGSKIAKMMIDDVDDELDIGLKGTKDYNSVIPDTYTKVVTRNLMKQLRDNWRAGDINMAVAKATIRVPFLKVVDFERSAEMKLVQSRKQQVLVLGEDMCDVEDDECEIEFKIVNQLHKDGARIAEV